MISRGGVGVGELRSVELYFDTQTPLSLLVFERLIFVVVRCKSCFVHGVISLSELFYFVEGSFVCW